MKYVLLTLMVAALVVVGGCKSSAPSQYSGSNGNTASANCSEPENPYDEGSGHYAGFEWAERNGAGECDGNSQSFNEGCEEYQNQESEYDQCEANRQN